MRGRVRTGGALFVVAILMVVAGSTCGSALAHRDGPRCTITGTAGPNVIRGTKGPDVICGGGGADKLYGLAGNDKIYGGAGPDHLYGGPGKDFVDGGPGKNFCLTQVGDRAGTGCAPAPQPKSAPSKPGPAPGAYCYTCAPVSPLGGPDTTAPYLRTMQLQPNSVDTSKGPGVLTFSLEVLDFGGSLKGGSIRIDGPAGFWRSIPIGSGSDPYDNLVKVPFEVPASTPAGRYEVADVTLEDGAGNARTLTAAELRASQFTTLFGEALDFDVFAGPDTDPPTLKGLTLTPSVDTSSSPANVGLTIAASDGLSGVASVSPVIAFPSTSNYPGVGHGSRLASGSVFDGTWDGSFSLAAHSPQGEYRIASLRLTDRAGNSVEYTEAELQAKGLRTRFTQVGSGDTTPPEILDFRIEPRTVHAAAGQRRFKVRMKVRDTLSGFGQFPNQGCSDLSFGFEEPGPQQPFTIGGRGPELISGTAEEGEWLLETELPTDAPVGTYPITDVAASDRACNQTLISGPTLEAEPWDLSFENAP